jgi:hypothetical protein
MGQGAWRTHSKILVTTFAIVVIYLLSWTPLLYSWVCMTDPRMSTLLEIPDHIYKIVIYFFMIALIANPVIYTCINKHFKSFLAVEIRSSLGSISNAFQRSSKQNASVKSVKCGERMAKGGDIEVEDDDDESMAASARCSEEDILDNERVTNGATTWDLTKMTAFSLTPVMKPRDKMLSREMNNGDKEEWRRDDRELLVSYKKDLPSDKNRLEVDRIVIGIGDEPKK